MATPTVSPGHAPGNDHAHSCPTSAHILSGQRELHTETSSEGLWDPPNTLNASCGRSSPEERLFSERLASYLYARRRLIALPPRGNEAEDDMVANAMIAAEELLTRTPAVNASDLRAKVEVLWCDPGAPIRWEDLAHVLADLRGLTGDEPSRVFDAQAWLDSFGRVDGMWLVRDGEVILLAPAAAADLMAELEACDGNAAVNALIAAQHAAKALAAAGAEEVDHAH